MILTPLAMNSNMIGFSCSLDFCVSPFLPLMRLIVTQDSMFNTSLAAKMSVPQRLRTTVCELNPLII